MTTKKVFTLSKEEATLIDDCFGLLSLIRSELDFDKERKNWEILLDATMALQEVFGMDIIEFEE